MTEQELLDKVRAIIVDHLGVNPESVQAHTHLINDLGMDSLDAVEFLMEIEDAFDLSIPDEAGEGITTVNDVVGYLKEHA